ncbi:MAG TPA: inositol monophosphatase family protein [Pyrinomonadaceae bacterium]|jgi:myo-inositol-1(or 4)-monophosphatase|nr:inositol monophosphatase family protein [Pyrinomonadaceae bacterium]
MLNFAIQTARDAGRVLAEKFGRALQVSNKGDIDLVTEADLAAEQLIVERIRSYHPRHRILAEESGETAREDRPSEFKWIIDPLDGTTNYAHGYPCFCVSIALEQAGEVIVGVVYDPTRDEMFAAERGGGATLNGRRVRVSDVEDLNAAMVCTGFPYDVRDRGDFARHFRNFIMRAQAVRRDGSAALDLAYVAAGRFDGFWEEGLRAWDVAAGKLLVEEAGGRVSRYDGSPFHIYEPPILASNGLLHEAMMRVLQMP